MPRSLVGLLAAVATAMAALVAYAHGGLAWAAIAIATAAAGLAAYAAAPPTSPPSRFPLPGRPAILKKMIT